MLDPSNLIGARNPITPLATGPVVGAGDRASADQVSVESQWSVRTMAAGMALTISLDGVEDLNVAASVTVRELAKYLSADRILLLWRTAPNRQLTVIGDTAADDGNQDQTAHRLAIAAGEEIAARGAPACWPADQNNRHAQLATAQFADHVAAKSVVGVALSSISDQVLGTVIVTDPQTADSSRFLQVIGPSLASRLSALQKSAPSYIERLIRRWVRVIHASRNRWALAATILLTVLLCLPLPYKVRAEVELQPVEHRFVSAPFDGPLQTANVRPGDTVAAGEVLARINPREIDYELAGVRAELEAAIQQHKGKMAEHDSAGSRIAALESERFRSKTELLQHRRDHLEIRSPIDGVVVNGDLKQREGMPLSRGESMFEIAPLGQVLVELSIAEDDYLHVRPGMPMDFYVHALPGKRLEARIDRIHPRAELRDNENVFIAEARIEDPQNILRPGMRGTAKVTSDRHTLAWNLFHKPYYAFRRALGW